MKEFKDILPEYWENLNERAQTSRVYKPYQQIGLELARILEDNSHKSLYMRLAKKYDNQELLATARRIAENDKINNKGAYFMKVWFDKDTKR